MSLSEVPVGSYMCIIDFKTAFLCVVTPRCFGPQLPPVPTRLEKAISNYGRCSLLVTSPIGLICIDLSLLRSLNLPNFHC